MTEICIWTLTITTSIFVLFTIILNNTIRLSRHFFAIFIRFIIIALVTTIQLSTKVMQYLYLLYDINFTLMILTKHHHIFTNSHY